jgi:hypothetical protein
MMPDGRDRGTLSTRPPEPHLLTNVERSAFIVHLAHQRIERLPQPRHRSPAGGTLCPPRESRLTAQGD